MIYDHEGENELSEGARVRTNWPGAVGHVTEITDPDGEYIGGRAVGYPSRVYVKWDNMLTNDAGQEWDEEYFVCSCHWHEDYETCDELEVIERHTRLSRAWEALKTGAFGFAIAELFHKET